MSSGDKQLEFESLAIVATPRPALGRTTVPLIPFSKI